VGIINGPTRKVAETVHFRRVRILTETYIIVSLSFHLHALARGRYRTKMRVEGSQMSSDPRAGVYVYQEELDLRPNIIRGAATLFKPLLSTQNKPKLLNLVQYEHLYENIHVPSFYKYRPEGVEMLSCPGPTCSDGHEPPLFVILQCAFLIFLKPALLLARISCFHLLPTCNCSIVLQHIIIISNIQRAR
jgi:hypothetical protein